MAQMGRTMWKWEARAGEAHDLEKFRIGGWVRRAEKSGRCPASLEASTHFGMLIGPADRSL